MYIRSALVSTLMVFNLASAWKMTVYLADGGHISTHGRLDSGCKTFDLDVERRKVSKVKFEDEVFDTASTFELYAQKNCAGSPSYREGDGTHQVVPARVIRSYKVY